MKRKAPSKKVAQKSQKAKNNSTPVKYTTKSLNWLHDPMLVMQRVTADFTEENAKEVAACILEWSARDDAWNLHQFCDLMLMPRETFESRAERWPVLNCAYGIARGRLAERRERKATFKEYEADSSMIKPTLRYYDYDWQRKYQEDIALEDRRREEQREHDREQLEKRLKQAEDTSATLLKYFETHNIELPELDVKEVTDLSTRDTGTTEEV